MWVEDIDDISIEYEENGELVIKQEAKAVVAHGTWPLILFLYRERDPKTGEFGPLKVSVRKFRKQHGTYRLEGKVNIGSLEQACRIASLIIEWAREYGQ